MADTVIGLTFEPKVIRSKKTGKAGNQGDEKAVGSHAVKTPDIFMDEAVVV